MRQILSFFKAKWNTKSGRAGLSICALLLLVCCGAAGYSTWYYLQPKFQDHTIELGQSELRLADFYTKYAKPERTAFVTDPATLDYSRPGRQQITLRQGKMEETVTLTIQDTTPPEAEFQDLSAAPGTALQAEDFVVSSFDLSGTTVRFASSTPALERYGTSTVTVLVADPYGNQISQDCTLRCVWLKEAFTLELGEKLKKEDLLLDSSATALLSQEEIDTVNQSPAGNYLISSSFSGMTLTCSVTIQDTTPPALKLRSVSVLKGQTASLDDFVVSASDLSGKADLTLLTKLNFSNYGTQNVRVRAVDPAGNETVGETTLRIVKDKTPPSFSGVSELTVAKNEKPDYKKGISAEDNLDGSVSFTFDDSEVDLTKAGTYHVIYRAIDSDGNQGTFRRTVTVMHDADDTAALVASWAKKCGSDPVDAKVYVRDHITYNHSYGGEDPVWYGLNSRLGNCYVHAKVLQAILEYHGYETQLIWTKDKTHYWTLVNLGDCWRHLDATPGGVSAETGLMTDEERLGCLVGRTWDHSAWPAAD